MKKVVRLTESDLIKIVKRIIKEQPEPIRQRYGTINTLKVNLTGKTVKMMGSSTKLNPILKIEEVEAISSKQGNYPNIAKDVVYLDCSIVNEYGEERGGIADMGGFGNVDVTYNCTNNPMKLFKIDREIGNPRNMEIGNETYVNPKLSNEIERSYCSSVKRIPTINTDY
jgi:hypothetical protein